MSAVELVVFDIGSTLVAGSPGHPARRIGERLSLTAEQRRQLNAVLMTHPFTSPAETALFARQKLAIDVDLLEAVIEEVWTAQEDEAFAADGALGVLEGLVAHGYRLALLSNIWQPYLTSVQRLFGAFFDRTIPAELQVFSCRAGRMKPAAALFGQVVAAAGVGPGSAVMVGDSYTTDIAPAMQVGMRTVWVLQRPEREVANLAAVVNGAAPGPTRAVGAIADLTADVVGSL